MRLRYAEARGTSRDTGPFAKWLGLRLDPDIRIDAGSPDRPRSLYGHSSRRVSWAIACIQACLSAHDQRLIAIRECGPRTEEG